jgi:hypothetical protein
LILLVLGKREAIPIAKNELKNLKEEEEEASGVSQKEKSKKSRTRNTMRNSNNYVGDDVYIVSVDSRGRSSADLEAYKECTCPRSFFEEHVVKHERIVCVKSQVAALCGMDLKMYFHEHHTDHSSSRHVEDTALDTSNCRKTNWAATLLTTDPETGHAKHKILGKAYIVLKEGESPLSKRQVWGIQELIKEARDMFHNPLEDKYEVNRELLRWCYQYQAGTWAPHAIYENRQEHRIHHHGRKVLDRGASILSDQATCHHGKKRRRRRRRRRRIKPSSLRLLMPFLYHSFILLYFKNRLRTCSSFRASWVLPFGWQTSCFRAPRHCSS